MIFYLHILHQLETFPYIYGKLQKLNQTLEIIYDSKITREQSITHKNSWVQIIHEFIFVFYHIYVNKYLQCPRPSVTSHAQQSTTSLGPQSMQDPIDKVVVAMAFSCNTWRKTHKDPSHPLLNIAIGWQLVEFFPSHRK